MKEYIIGRGGTQPFTIADSCRGVSHKHARLTITDSGEWWIENLSGPQGNGVFLKTGPNNFERVEKRRIDEDTIIRLGEGSHLSYTFMAHRAVELPGNYAYEFLDLRKRFNLYKKAIADVEAENKRRSKMANTIMTIFIVLSVGIVLWSWLSGHGLNGMSPMLFTGLVATLSRTMFGPKTDQLKKLMALRQTEFVCPVCGMPMSDFAIANLKCQACKSS